MVFVNLKPDLLTRYDTENILSGHGGFKDIEKATRLIKEHLRDYPNKPVLHGEVNFEGMRGSSWQDVQRFLFWSHMLMGTAGFSYRVEGIWQFNTDEMLFGPSPGGNTWGNIPCEIAYQYAGSKQVGVGNKILKNYPWWESEALHSGLSSLAIR